MIAASATRQQAGPAHPGKVKRWLSEVFALNFAGLNWARGVMIIDVLLVPLVVFWSIGHEEYLLAAIFGVLFTALVDPGGSFGSRAASGAVFGLIGAGLTAACYAVSGEGWGWLVLVASVATLLAGLAITLGVHRFVAGLLLNVWVVIALALAYSHHTSHPDHANYIWAQVVSWTGGSALWIVVTFFAWLIRGRVDVPQPIAEIPGDTSPRKLNAPVIMFALLRTVAIGGATALAFGANLSHGLWLPIATIVAMKPTLEASSVIAAQRIFGALIGAGVAALLLLIPANEHGAKLLAITRGLEVVALVLFMHAASVRFWNYVGYYAAISAGVLILLDLPQPSNYSAEGYRVLWALCGVAIGVVVMFLAGLLAKRSAKAPAQPAAQRT